MCIKISRSGISEKGHLFQETSTCFNQNNLTDLQHYNKPKILLTYYDSFQLIIGIAISIYLSYSSKKKFLKIWKCNFFLQMFCFVLLSFRAVITVAVFHVIDNVLLIPISRKNIFFTTVSTRGIWYSNYHYVQLLVNVCFIR